MGIYALAITIAGIFSLVGQLGLQTSTVRFIAQYAGQKNWGTVDLLYHKILRLIFPSTILSALLLYFTSHYIANNIFNKPELVVPFKIISLSLPFGGFFNLNTSALRGLKRIRDSFIFQLIVPVTSFFILIFLTYLIIKNYLTPIYTQLVVGIISALLSWIFWRKAIKNKGKVNNMQYVSYREIIKVSLPMMITTGMLFVLGWTDTFMLGMFKTNADVGIYRVAMRIALFSSFTLGAVNSIAAPKLSELYWSSENERLRRVIKNASKMIFWSSLPIFALTVIFSTQILFLFGSEFVSGKSTLIILSFGQFMNAYFGSVGVLLDMTGNQNYFRNAMIISAFINIILNYILIPLYGIFGAALATAISTVTWNLIASFSVLKIFGFWVGYVPEFLIKRV